MVEALGLEALRRVCCHREAPERWFKFADGREISIIEVSNETAVVSRGDRANIAVVETVMEMLTEID